MRRKTSLAGQPYFSYVHACAYEKWAEGYFPTYTHARMKSGQEKYGWPARLKKD